MTGSWTMDAFIIGCIIIIVIPLAIWIYREVYQKQRRNKNG